MVMFSQFK